MATYAELRLASEDPSLSIKVQVACVIAANAIANEGAPPLHAERLKWARTVFQSPAEAARSMMWVVLAANAGATYAAIIGASDATVQTAVNAGVSSFALAA